MKFFKKVLLVVLSAVLLISASACKPKNQNQSTGSIDSVDQYDDTDRSGWVPYNKATYDSPRELRIKFFNGGYGRAWLDAMKEKFESEYPNVTVILTPSTNETEFTQTITTTLEGNPDDIYVCHNIPWERLSVKNLIMNLDNLYNATVYTDTNKDNASVRFVDRIAPSSLNLTNFNGHYYTVPEVQGAGGIAYNKTMFDKYGWKVPSTYAELKELCETIVKANLKTDEGETITPFVWPGSVAYLWDSVVYDWWVQIAGIDEFNEFMKYENKDMFNSEKYPALKKAWTYWHDLIVLNQNYSHPQTLQMDNVQCNTAFAAGQAAMMPATCWAANEVGSELLTAFNCDMGIIPTPFVPEAKKDANGNPIRVAYDMAGKDSFVIAQRGKNKDVAVEFFKWMSLEENALLFPENANGLLLAMKYDFDNLIETGAKTTWQKEMFNLLNTSIRFNLYSSSPMVYNASTPLSPYPLGNYYQEAYQFHGTESARDPDAVFSASWEEIDKTWDTRRAAAGL